MSRNLGNIYVSRLLVLSYVKVQFQLIDIFSFFYLLCKLLRSDLEIINLIFDIFRSVGSASIIGYLVLSYVEKLISTARHFLATFCWLISFMSWISYYFICLNYQHISSMSRRLSIVYVWGLLVFSCMESSILTIFYIFRFCLVCKLYKSSLKILHLILGHLIFLGSVDIKCYLVVAYFERWVLAPAYFSDFFFLSHKLYMPGRPVYHTNFWTWAMFHLRVFSIDIENK